MTPRPPSQQTSLVATVAFCLQPVLCAVVGVLTPGSSLMNRYCPTGCFCGPRCPAFRIDLGTPFKTPSHLSLVYSLTLSSAKLSNAVPTCGAYPRILGPFPSCSILLTFPPLCLLGPTIIT